MKDKTTINLQAKIIEIHIGRLEIKSRDGSIHRMRIRIDGKETNFIEVMDIHITGLQIRPRITMKIDTTDYARVIAEMEGEKE